MNRNGSLVSIIVPFLNAEKFFREAIESVFAQTYERWELLLVDDGSTDRSTAMAQSYAEQHPDKVRWLEHPGHRNRGKSSSRNLGIQQARGEYLVFLDADDVLLPEKLERQVSLLETQPGVGMVYGATLYWYSWTEKPQDIRRDFKGNLGVRPDALFQPPALLTRFLQDSGIVPCLCAPLVRRQIVDAVGGFDETIQHMYEDQVFLAKVCLETAVFVEGGCGEKYRQHPDSSSQMAIKTGEYHPFWPNPARLSFLVWLGTYLYRRGVEDTALQRTLKRELWLYRRPGLHRLISACQYLIMWIKGYPGAVRKRTFNPIRNRKLEVSR